MAFLPFSSHFPARGALQQQALTVRGKVPYTNVQYIRTLYIRSKKLFSSILSS